MSVGFYLAADCRPATACNGRGERPRRYRWGAWALVAVLAMSAAMNLASDSPWENYLFAPLALVLAGLCLVIARSASTRAAGGSGVAVSTQRTSPADSTASRPT